jgi:biotin carboxyl carrier protein
MAAAKDSGNVHHDLDVNGQLRQVAVRRRDGRFVVSIGDREWIVDAAHVGPHTLSLLVERSTRPGEADAGVVQSRELSIASEPVSGRLVVGVKGLPVLVDLNSRRRWGRRDDGAAGTGPQRLVAPMPGKVVRILARAGAPVVHRQPVIVIEAMKMENELRALRDGTVTDVLVQEGQSVEPGTLLAIITPS